MKITNTDSIGVQPLKMLVYGESGVGKTTLARTIKDSAIIISAESGLLSLKGTKIDVIDISKDDNGALIPKEKRISRVGEVYKFLLTPEAQAKYKWVFIDSITEIGQNLVEQLNTEHPERKDALVMWGEYAKKMRSLIKSFRDLPGYHVVMTCLSSWDKDASGKYRFGLDLNGKIASQVPQYMDLVCFLQTDADGVRTLHTQKTETILAKDRSGKLAPREVPDLQLIADKIRGGK